MWRRFWLGFCWGQVALFGAATLAWAQGSYVVQAGDTLGALAARFGVGVQALAQHNGLPSPDLIYEGQHLSLPAGSGGAAAAGTGAGTVGAAAAGHAGGEHLVAPGETLGQIAARYGSSVDALVRINNLASPNLIWAGITLRLPAGAGPPAAAIGQPARQRVVIDLGDSRLYAYEGDALVQAFAVSTGGPGTATPVGSFHIRSRYARQDMSGPGYFAPDVPWVQYFHGNYAIHGTYWHNSFGTAVSHGCVNMRTPDAQWLYFWTTEGTPVEVRW